MIPEVYQSEQKALISMLEELPEKIPDKLKELPIFAKIKTDLDSVLDEVKKAEDEHELIYCSHKSIAIKGYLLSRVQYELSRVLTGVEKSIMSNREYQKTKGGKKK